MAEALPLNALHYNLAAVSALGDVVAPPYDVIDAELRRELVARSPFNVVEMDLPEALGDADRYEHAAETLEEWSLQGVLTPDREPALWALTQDYVGPDGAAPHPPRAARARARHRLRAGAGPAPRAHPAGSQGGPAAADPGHPPQPLPHLLPLCRRRLAACRAGHRRGALGRGHRRGRHDPPRLANRRPGGARRRDSRARQRRAPDRRRPSPLRDRPHLRRGDRRRRRRTATR